MTISIPQSNLIKVSELLQAICPQPRLEILLVIGTGEACVCHLEAATGWRQAYISQHLMALRSEGLVISRRDGRNIYYRLKNTGVFNLIREAARISGVSDIETAKDRLAEPLPNCPCPHCSAQETHNRSEKLPSLIVENT